MSKKIKTSTCLIASVALIGGTIIGYQRLHHSNISSTANSYLSESRSTVSEHDLTFSFSESSNGYKLSVFYKPVHGDEIDTIYYDSNRDGLVDQIDSFKFDKDGSAHISFYRDMYTPQSSENVTEETSANSRELSALREENKWRFSRADDAFFEPLMEYIKSKRPSRK